MITVDDVVYLLPVDITHRSKTELRYRMSRGGSMTLLFGKKPGLTEFTLMALIVRDQHGKKQLGVKFEPEHTPADLGRYVANNLCKKEG